MLLGDPGTAKSQARQACTRTGTCRVEVKCRQLGHGQILKFGEKAAPISVFGAEPLAIASSRLHRGTSYRGTRVEKEAALRV